MTGGDRVFWAFIALLVLLNFVLQVGLGLGGAAPDLLTVAVLLGARRLRGVGAAALGLGLGVLRDALALVGFGASAVALTVTGYLGARSRDLFVGDTTIFVAVYVFLGKWFHDLLYRAAESAVAGGGMVARKGAAAQLLVDAPLAALYAAGAAVLVVLVYQAVTGRR